MFQGVEDAVRAFVHLTVAVALRVIHTAIDVVSFALAVSVNAIHDAISFVGSQITSALDWIAHAAETVGQWIRDGWNIFFHDVIAPIVQGLRDLVSFTDALINDAIQAIKDGVSWLITNVVAPVVGWVEHAAETVGQWIRDGWNTFYHDVIAPIVAAADYAYHLLDTVWQWLMHYGAIVARFFDHVGTWFFDFLFDPIGTLQRLGDAARSEFSLSGITGAAQGVAGEAQAFADDVAAWFS
ncbi:MAG: hypothetical protein ACRDUW_05030 [Pseudonocardiaceae bacterium]